MQHRKIEHSLSGFIKAGLQTGFLLAVVNLIWYLFSVKLLFIEAPERISIFSVVTFSIAISLILSLALYFIFPRIKKPVLVFRGVCFILSLVSLILPLRLTLPDGAPLPDRYNVLVLPLYILAGIITGYFIPKFLKGDIGAMFRQTS